MNIDFSMDTFEILRAYHITWHEIVQKVSACSSNISLSLDLPGPSLVRNMTSHIR